ncbi:MAG: hypothetical protein JXQ23_08965 [Clostridia bacterium]|nr:hypothetical protein [Clostridia bacterium]
MIEAIDKKFLIKYNNYKEYEKKRGFMDSRERVFKTFDFEKTDQIALQYHPSPRGYFEHGEKLRKLFIKYKDDFDDVTHEEIPVIPSYAYDKNGDYYDEIEDEFGILWQYRIFKIMGHPLKRPLDDLDHINTYQFPKPKYGDDTFIKAVREQKKTRFVLKGGVTLFERMTAVRRFEDVLMDMYSDTIEINRIADLFTEFYLKEIDNLIKADVDAVFFGDDFGTQKDLLISPEIFRNFLKPRYKIMIDKVHQAGKKVHFHSCGANLKLLDDMADLKIDSYWPQLTAYDTRELAKILRDYKIATSLHFRGQIMNFGTPDDVRRWVSTVSEHFDVKNGGSWFYIEIDDRFKFENIEALFEIINELR